MLNNLFLELHVPDFQIAIDFYKILGFEVVWISDEYMVMKRAQTVLFFYPGDDRVYEHSYFRQFSKDTKRGYGVEIVLYVDDVQGLYAQIKDQVKIVTPLVKKRWGLYDFRIEDPFGYYLRISEPQDLLHDQEKVARTEKIARQRGLRL